MTTEKAVYIGAPACFKLDLACGQLNKAFDGQCYLVGSALEKPDWRDVDVRLMLSDEHFATLFPNCINGTWELNTRWLVMTVSLSDWLSSQTGLPVDFQFQPTTFANERYNGIRNALGLNIHYSK